MTTKMSKKKHIDDVQFATVDEHFQYLVNNKEFIDGDDRDVTPNDLPDWYNPELFRAGQMYYQRNMMPMGLASLLGLVSVLTIPSTIEVLIYTKQSGTPCSAFKRYLQTLLHMYTLSYADVNDGNSKWYKTVNIIRWKHSTTHNKIHRANVGGISQKDMALTLFGFIGYSMISTDILRLKPKMEDREAYNHFWRVIGHMIGIDDRINICRKNATETTKLCQRISDEIMAKYLRDVTPEIVYMIKTMLDGFWYIDVTLNVDAVIALCYRVSNIPYTKPLSWWSWINMQYRDFMLYLGGIPYLGIVTRTYFNYLLQFTYWSLERWPIAAWMSFGKKKSHILLYPSKYQ